MHTMEIICIIAIMCTDFVILSFDASKAPYVRADPSIRDFEIFNTRTIRLVPVGFDSAESL